jgi:GT2 family glycosyltransferase
VGKQDPQDSWVAMVSRVIGLLVTYRRQHLLAGTLRRIFQQTRPLDELWVIDNEGAATNREIVDAVSTEYHRHGVHYVAMAENLGSAGGWAHGMRLALPTASDDDWLMPLDDDNPPRSTTEIEHVVQFASQMQLDRPRLAAAGIVGGKFNWRSGLIARVPDSELQGPVSVDFLGCGYQPLYSASAMRDVGVFDQNLFFGYTEVEYGLRLQAAGYVLLADGDAWYRLRQEQGRIGITRRPSRRCVATWHKYYSIRNYIYIMRRLGRWPFAAKQALIQCVLKPLYTLPADPRTACAGFRLAWMATRDGFAGRMGRRIEPVMTERRDPAATRVGRAPNLLTPISGSPK